jgi:DNA-directed RNA polymerase specialized sigma24 family protein
MDLTRYRRLQRLASRLCRHADEAEDLLHDTLVAGLEAGRDDAAWLGGVLRKQAALAARSATRRRRREGLVANEVDAIQDPPSSSAPPDPRPLLQRLPPSARRLAVLVLHGLDADEIRWILGLSATAFRQRLTRIRRALVTLSSDQREAVLAASTWRVDLDGARPLGALRRALRVALLGAGTGLGTHDSDGHLLVIRRSAHTFPHGGNHTGGCPLGKE